MKLQRLFFGALLTALVLIAPARATEQNSYVIPDTGPHSMTDLVDNYFNPAFRAVASCHWGTSAPANGPGSAALPYQCWADTTANPVVVKRYDGTQWVAFGDVNTSTHVWRPYLTSGTSGGVPFFSTTGIMGSSAALAVNGFVIGGGAGVAPATITACTDNQIPFGRTSNSPLCRTVTGDIIFTAGAAALVNIPTATTQAGYIAATAIAAPATPSAGIVRGYYDSSALRFQDKNSLGVVATTVVIATCSSSNWVNQIQTTGVAACTQPNFTDLAGSIAAAQIPSATITYAKIQNVAARRLLGNATGSAAAPAEIDIAALTTKASPAAGDYVILSDQASSGDIKKATVSSVASAGSVSSLNGQTGAVVTYFPPQGRLTLTSGTPVMTSSVTAGTSVYYTPYVGDLVPIYDGTNIVPTVFAELTIALGSNWATNSNYDVFLATDSGTLRACTGPAWTSDTGRGTGAGTTELEIVKGFRLNKVQVTCRYNNTTTFTVSADRGTYVGTFRTGSAGQTNFILGGSASGGTAGLLGVWNMYNRVLTTAIVTDSGTSYTYTTATIRQARASAGNQVSFVLGLQEDAVPATYSFRSVLVAAVQAGVQCGFGLDTTTAFSTQQAYLQTPAAAIINAATTVAYNFSVGIGFHYIAALENGDGTNANTFDQGLANGLTVAVRN